MLFESPINQFLLELCQDSVLHWISTCTVIHSFHQCPARITQVWHRRWALHCPSYSIPFYEKNIQLCSPWWPLWQKSSLIIPFSLYVQTGCCIQRLELLHLFWHVELQSAPFNPSLKKDALVMAGEVTEQPPLQQLKKQHLELELRHFYFSYHDTKLNPSQMQGFSWLTPGEWRVLTALSA